MRLADALTKYNRAGNGTPGLRGSKRQTFVEQLLDSIRRVSFPRVIASRPISPLRSDPASPLFDPLRAAVLCSRTRRLEEAFWLVFLSVHFGKHRRSGWTFVKSVYGALGAGRWDWRTTSADPTRFRSWLDQHEDALRATRGGFGNHRKYQSLSANSPTGTGAVVESYVRWVERSRTHARLMRMALADAGGEPKAAFDHLYGSMNAVTGFGRTARFDYLTMVGNLNLATIEPGSTYMTGATGPRKGARLLFGMDQSPSELDSKLIALDHYLGVGMQVLEDALCNWQKSPSRFIRFRL